MRKAWHCTLLPCAEEGGAGSNAKMGGAGSLSVSVPLADDFLAKLFVMLRIYMMTSHCTDA